MLTGMRQEKAVSLFGSAEADEAIKGLRRKQSNGTRFMLGIIGPPGSGKSTLAARLQDYFAPGESIVVPMDGFHLANAVISGTALKDRRGAIDTFDGGGYISLLRRLKERKEPLVYVPDFCRDIDEPIAASIAVPTDIPLVITEGNYLLADEEPWSGVRGILDEVWYVDTPAELRMSRLIERHVAFGMDRAAAEAWATGPDEANARLIESTRHRADRIIPWL